MQGDLEALRERSDVQVDEAFVLENPWLLKATLSGPGRDGGGSSSAR